MSAVRNTLWRLSLLETESMGPWLECTVEASLEFQHFARANKMFCLRRGDCYFWNVVKPCKDTGAFGLLLLFVQLRGRPPDLGFFIT